VPSSASRTGKKNSSKRALAAVCASTIAFVVSSSRYFPEASFAIFSSVTLDE